MQIKDKVVIITGASSGIGEAAARLLAEQGAKVVLAARSIDKLEELSKELPNSLAVPTDMTDEQSIKNMIAKAKEHYGRVDILINNAGRGESWTNVESLDVDRFRSLMELNIYGPIIAMQQVIPIMRAQDGGVIINIGSGTVRMMQPGASMYPGTKILLTHISKVARRELEKDNITVSIIHPFITATNFFENIRRSTGSQPAAAREDFMSHADPPEKVANKILEVIESGEEESSLRPPNNW